MKIQSLLLRWLSGGARLLALGMAVGCGPNSQGLLSELAMGSAGTGSPGAGGNNPLVTGGAGGGFFVGSSGEAGTGAKCERNVSLTAVTLGEPQPFDLIIVADNSDSVAWSRNELSNGLHDLLTQV